MIIATGDELVFSKQTWDEFESVLLRPKFDRYLSKVQREETLAGFFDIGLFVEPKRNFDHCRDPKDNQFLDVSVEGNVDALITGDKDLLVLEKIESIPIIRIADFLG